MNRNRKILIAATALLGLTFGVGTVLATGLDRTHRASPSRTADAPTTTTVPSTTAPGPTTTVPVPATEPGNDDSPADAGPGAPADPGDGNGNGNGGQMAPENPGQANAGNNPWNSPIQNIPLNGNPQFQPADTQGPSIAFQSVVCDTLNVVVVVKVSDPSGIAAVTASVKTTNQLGAPNPTKYPAMNQILTGVYSISFPAGKWQTSMISVGALDNAGNKTGIDKSNFCSA